MEEQILNMPLTKDKKSYAKEELTSAAEFYLANMNSPGELFKNYEGLEKHFDAWRQNRLDNRVLYKLSYREWLFKLSFKGLFKNFKEIKLKHKKNIEILVNHPTASSGVPVA